jgi:hypothetical protein
LLHPVAAAAAMKQHRKGKKLNAVLRGKEDESEIEKIKVCVNLLLLLLLLLRERLKMVLLELGIGFDFDSALEKCVVVISF